MFVFNANALDGDTVVSSFTNENDTLCSTEASPEVLDPNSKKNLNITKLVKLFSQLKMLL